MATLLRTMFLHPAISPNAQSESRTGWWAWILQRVTGVLLVVYLLIHIAVISTSLFGADTFDAVLKFVQHPIFAIANIVLIAITLYHTFNGVRVILFDIGLGITRQATGFWMCIALTAVGSGISAILSLPLIFR